jgi:hypothetical protein
VEFGKGGTGAMAVNLEEELARSDHWKHLLTRDEILTVGKIDTQALVKFFLSLVPTVF